MKYTIIKPDPHLQDNLMAFGFMCGTGWYPLIYELLDKIQTIVNKTGLDTEVTEVKEKYGGLRVYMSSTTDEIDTLIRAYEALALVTCEECGRPGEMRDKRGWYKTLCDECHEKWRHQ